MAENRTIRGTRVAWHASILFAAIAGVWSVASLLTALSQINWQVSELARQYLVAIGLISEFHTLSDFYTHIKGVEYIIVVMFLGAFPLFYTYLNKPKQGVITT